MRNVGKRIGLVLLLCGSLALPLHADDAAAIRARTQARRPVIAELVKTGAVAEAANGYLEIKDAAALGDKGDMVEAENRDRKAAYQAIAKSTGLTVDEVARRQAQRLRSGAR